MEINGEISEKLAFLEMRCRSGAKRVEARSHSDHITLNFSAIFPQNLSILIPVSISGGQYVQGCAKENVCGQVGAGVAV